MPMSKWNALTLNLTITNDYICSSDIRMMILCNIQIKPNGQSIFLTLNVLKLGFFRLIETESSLEWTKEVLILNLKTRDFHI